MVPCDHPGVYVVADPGALLDAPINLGIVSGWIDRVATLRLDGKRPSTSTLANRLASFWLPNEPVVYIGMAGTSVRNRVGQFYRTPLGDPRPHAGGHWLKVLANLGSLRVWWARTDDAEPSEIELLRVFERRHGFGALPFANREGADGQRKPHGISASVLPRTVKEPRDEAAPTQPPRNPVAAPAASGGWLENINDELQRLAFAAPDREITAVDAAVALDRMDLLRDSDQRPGRPLRDLLRAGKIANAYQKSGRFWYIRCGRREG